MSTQTVVLSDLTGKPVSEMDRVRLIVWQHPELEEPALLDASDTELSSVRGAKTDVVVLALSKDGEVEKATITVAAFNQLFDGNPSEILARAPRMLPEGAPAKQKRSPSELQAIREWARSNGWPDLSDRGRIPAEIEQAYVQANG